MTAPNVAVTATVEPGTPEAPPVAPQVVALETAGTVDLAREQGKQGVTLDALASTVTAQAAELASLRAETAALRESRAAQPSVTEVAALVTEQLSEGEDAPEEAETEVTAIEVAAITKPSTPNAKSGNEPAPRRERHPILVALLGKLP